MKALCSIILTVIVLSGCAKKELSPTPFTYTSSVPKDTVTYLALGDSYTIGEAVTQSESFPYQLKTFLLDSSIFVKPPTIIATTGWTTENLINAIAGSNITGQKYDFVTLLIGVNDEHLKITQNDYRINFTKLLSTAIGFAGGNKKRVFVLSIPDYGVTPNAGGLESVIGPDIDQFNAINKGISDTAGVNYLNITPISRQAATDPRLIAPDGLHPSALMYNMWMQLLTPMVAAQLKK